MSERTPPRPTRIRLHRKSRVMEISFEDGQEFHLSCEYLRVFSPSAEVQGHGPGQQVLETGKENVGITQIEPVGNYAVRLHFDDGHNTGLYSWSVLYELGMNAERNWTRYLERLEKAGYRREA
ncbi:MAG TPA: DUF971 domain-containing protein [Gammaproteobacteria bacterium]|nr:DUF971 domain-containing protein [Gammaproteobacteria bacterium]